MKKLALAVFLLSSVLFSHNSMAQKRKDSGYDKGTVLINGGLSGGYFIGPYYADVTFPALIGNVEWSVHEWVGLGPFIGFRGYNGGSTVAFGGRGTFHYGQFIPGLNTRSVDLYGTLNLGYSVTHVNNYYSNGNDRNWANAIIGPVAGARYFFNNGGFGAFAEAGWGPLGFLTIGLSGKF